MGSTTRTPAAVSRALKQLGEDITTWRKLRHLTRQEVADRAGVGVQTVRRLEVGEGVAVENLLRVARALGALDQIAGALDPYSTDVGRLRAEQSLPSRVRHRGTP